MKSSSLEDNLNITETDDGVVFGVYVQPRASRNEVTGISAGELKLRLTSPPVEGSANKLCVELLADLLRVPKSKVHLVRGEKSRHKVIQVTNVTKTDVLMLLQKSLERS